MAIRLGFVSKVAFAFLISFPSFAEGLSISCGSSEGYSYFFEGGVIDRANSGFTDDSISDGKISLTMNEKGEGDILTIDSTGSVKSAKSQGAEVLVLPAGGSSANWMAMYSDGTMEVYSFSGNSNKVAVYRNTVGHDLIAKNSLFISDCQ